MPQILENNTSLDLKTMVNYIFEEALGFTGAIEGSFWGIFWDLISKVNFIKKVLSNTE